MNLGGGFVSNEQADQIKKQVIDRLQVPDWVPIILVGPPVSLTVVGEPEDPDDHG